MTTKPPFLKRKWQKFLGRLWTERCPVWTPLFSFAFGDDPLSRVHRRALEITRPRHAAAKSVIHTIYWPIRAAILLAFALPRIDQEAFGIDASGPRLFATFWWLMVRHNIYIDSAIKFRLWQPENFARAREYIQHQEIIVLLPWLGAQQAGKGIESKSAFSELCAAHDIPHAGNVAVYHDGERVGQTPGFPAADLFSKLDGSYGGSDGRAWAHDAASGTWRNGDLTLDAEALDRHFRSLSEGARIVVQRRLTNAETLAPLSNGYLCTSRVVVIRPPGEAPSIFRAAFRMPVGSNEVDNFVAGGLAAIVDETGRLSPAIQKKMGTRHVSVHPDTGALIEGYRIDGWQAVLDLAIEAHGRLTELSTVGWDIALTPDGPVLVEANVGWCAEILQKPESEPLGEPFARFFVRSAVRRLDTRGPGAKEG